MSRRRRELEDIIFKEKNLSTLTEDYYNELVYVTKLYNKINEYGNKKFKD